MYMIIESQVQRMSLFEIQRESPMTESDISLSMMDDRTDWLSNTLASMQRRFEDNSMVLNKNIRCMIPLHHVNIIK